MVGYVLYAGALDNLTIRLLIILLPPPLDHLSPRSLFYAGIYANMEDSKLDIVVVLSGVSFPNCSQAWWS